MNEAYLKQRLVKAIKEKMPGAVVVRHEDQFTAGIPDISITWAGVTSWVEVKYSRAGRRARVTPLQRAALDRLFAAGAPAYLLEYREVRTAKSAELDRVNTGVEVFAGFDHRGIAEALRDEHLRRGSDVSLVQAFMEKFSIPVGKEPKYDRDIAWRRYNHLHEEFGELFRAINQKDLPEIADATVDLVYVALGLALELGIPWKQAFREVHSANMRKVRAVAVKLDDAGEPALLSVGEFKAPEGKKLFIHKPNGWKGPDIAGVLKRAGWKEN